MSAKGGGDSDLASGIVNVQKYASPVPPKKDFEQWHRPRKQLVRDRQWCVQISALMASIPGATEVKYFGLPGPDLLDIRCFHDVVCKPKGLNLRYLGFCDAAKPGNKNNIELGISIDEVSRLPNIDAKSDVIADDIKWLTNDASVAWKRTLEVGPFDVVNLDLCDGFAKDPAGEISNTYYNAVQRLMTLQNRRLQPWLLLLTTRVGPGFIQADTLNQLKDIYSENLSGCAEFRNASEKLFGIPNAATMGKAVQTDKGLQRVFLVGLCKWLVKSGLSFNPQSNVTVKGALSYRVDPPYDGVEDMVSLAIHIDPTLVVPKDAGKLANLRAQAAPTECELAVSAISELDKMGNVDRIFAKNAALRTKMTNDMAALLELARYDVAAYKAWAATR